MTFERIRTVVVGITVGSFTIAALLGIAALLRGGEMRELEANVLATTALIGAISLAVLCCMTPDGRGRVVGGTGVVVALVPLVTLLLLIWRTEQPMIVVELALTGTLFTALFAQTSMLLAVAGDARQTVVRIVLAVTLLCSTAVALLYLPSIWLDDGPGDWYSFRVHGVLGIIAVLGTICLPAYRLMGRLRSAPSMTWTDLRETPTRSGLTDELWVEIDEVSQMSGRPVEDIVREAVRRHREELVAGGHATR